ncbi:MAG: ABC transporter substrate-binding protein [Dehalococcoidia bacterium]
MNGTALGRRALLIGGGALAGAAALTLAGCGGDDTESGSGSDSAGAAGADPAVNSPKKGGTLVVDSGEPATDALIYAFNATNMYLRWAIWDNLIIQGVDNRPRMMLAEQFEMKPDFTGVHVKLRPGLTFHNGRPLTAEDVRFSIEAFRADKINSQLKNPGRLITEITVADPQTLDITFAAPRPFMEDYFALLPIVDKDTLDQQPQMKVLNGAGPFKFVSFTPNQGYELERNPNYWDSGKPYLDKIQGRIYADDESRALALQSGELMHTNQASYAMVKRLKDVKDITIEDGGVGGSWYAGLVTSFPAMSDPRVRRALTFAIDRRRIAEEWGEGVIEPQMLPWPKESPAYLPEDEALLTYDPDQAKSLLKQAGAEGITIPMDIGQGREDIAQYVQDAWKAIGVNAQLNLSEYAAYLERFRSRKVEAMFVAPFGFSDNMHPATFFEFAQPVRIPNPSHYDTPAYRELLAKITEANPRSPQGKELFHQWNKLYLVDDPWMAPLAPNTAFFAMRKQVIAPAKGAMERPPFSEIWIDA